MNNLGGLPKAMADLVQENFLDRAFKDALQTAGENKLADAIRYVNAICRNIRDCEKEQAKLAVNIQMQGGVAQPGSFEWGGITLSNQQALDLLSPRLRQAVIDKQHRVLLEAMLWCKCHRRPGEKRVERLP